MCSAWLSDSTCISHFSPPSTLSWTARLSPWQTEIHPSRLISVATFSLKFLISCLPSKLDKTAHKPPVAVRTPSCTLVFDSLSGGHVADSSPCSNLHSNVAVSPLQRDLLLWCHRLPYSFLALTTTWSLTNLFACLLSISLQWIISFLRAGILPVLSSSEPPPQDRAWHTEGLNNYTFND